MVFHTPSAIGQSEPYINAFRHLTALLRGAHQLPSSLHWFQTCDRHAMWWSWTYDRFGTLTQGALWTPFDEHRYSTGSPSWTRRTHWVPSDGLRHVMGSQFWSHPLLWDVMFHAQRSQHFKNINWLFNSPSSLWPKAISLQLNSGIAILLKLWSSQAPQTLCGCQYGTPGSPKCSETRKRETPRPSFLEVKKSSEFTSCLEQCEAHNSTISLTVGKRACKTTGL